MSRSSHLEEVVKRMVPDMPSYMIEDLKTTRRRFDEKKEMTKEQAADQVIAYIECKNREIYNGLLENGRTENFRKKLIKALPN